MFMRERSASLKNIPARKGTPPSFPFSFDFSSSLFSLDLYALERKSILKRMKAFEKGSMRELHLEKMELRQFPELLVDEKKIEKFRSKLKMLSLNGNFIPLIPDNFMRIGNFLRTITISNNNLHFLPQNIGELVSLTQLDVSYNSIDSIPESLSLLTNLKELSVAWNKMKEISSGIFPTLGNLSAIDLSGNQLTLLPNDICTLSKLSILSCAYNSLLKLPDDIGNMVGITGLNIAFNSLSELPASIGRLENLRDLQLWENKVCSSLILFPLVAYSLLCRWLFFLLGFALWKKHVASK